MSPSNDSSCPSKGPRLNTAIPAVSSSTDGDIRKRIPEDHFPLQWSTDRPRESQSETPGRQLRLHEFHMAPTCQRQRSEIFSIRRDDVVAVLGDEDDRSVDQIRHARCPEEHAGSPTEFLVDRSDILPAEAWDKRSLTRSTPPHLPEDGGVGPGYFASNVRRFQPDPTGPLAPLNSNESAGVEYKAHGAPRLARPADAFEPPPGPRTTTDCSRSRRAWVAISSAVICPCSAS